MGWTAPASRAIDWHFDPLPPLMQPSADSLGGFSRSRLLKKSAPGIHLHVRRPAHCSAISNVVSPNGDGICTQPSVKVKDFVLSEAIVTDLARWATGPVSVRTGTASSALHLPLMMLPLTIKSTGKSPATPGPGPKVGAALDHVVPDCAALGIAAGDTAQLDAIGSRRRAVRAGRSNRSFPYSTSPAPSGSAGDVGRGLVRQYGKSTASTPRPAGRRR